MPGAKQLLRRMVPSGFLHWCPACKRVHGIRTGDGWWGFDGNFEKPSFIPQIRIWSSVDENGKPYPAGKTRTLCSYSITRGIIEYTHECPHEWAGMVTPLPELPLPYRE